MSKRRVLRSRFSVGHFQVEMVMEPDGAIQPGTVSLLSVEWSPCMPRHEDFTREMVDQYRAGRDAFMVMVSKAIGLSIGVVEI